jgi:hypothetical protein
MLVREWECEVHLGIDRDFKPARKAHPAFIVDNLHALSATLKLAGYRVAQDLPLEECDRVYVSDPFENRIELMEIKTPHHNA